MNLLEIMEKMYAAVAFAEGDEADTALRIADNRPAEDNRKREKVRTRKQTDSRARLRV